MRDTLTQWVGSVNTDSPLVRFRQDQTTEDSMSNDWTSIEALADELHVPVRTVYAWRHRGLGPRGYKIGKHVRFRRADVEAWLERQADQPQPAA